MVSNSSQPNPAGFILTARLSYLPDTYYNYLISDYRDQDSTATKYLR